ncbi:hypothetical protein S245_052615 [Arachis hypogaea]
MKQHVKNLNPDYPLSICFLFCHALISPKYFSKKDDFQASSISSTKSKVSIILNDFILFISLRMCQYLRRHGITSSVINGIANFSMMLLLFLYDIHVNCPFNCLRIHCYFIVIDVFSF